MEAGVCNLFLYFFIFFHILNRLLCLQGGNFTNVLHCLRCKTCRVNLFQNSWHSLKQNKQFWVAESLKNNFFLRFEFNKCTESAVHQPAVVLCRHIYLCLCCQWFSPSVAQPHPTLSLVFQTHACLWMHGLWMTLDSFTLWVSLNTQSKDT